MSEVVTFVSHELVIFRPFDTWVDLKFFEIQTEAPDHSLLARLIEDVQYHDHYAGQDPSEQSQNDLHGPYWLDAITAEVFEPVSGASAGQELREWVSSWADPQDEDRPEVEAKLAADVLPHLDGDSILRLPDLRQTAEHEWGWVVGNAGFHEFVVINRAAATLTLLVASDD